MENSIENVWLIENNELKKSSKKVSKINYNGLEIPVLKAELDNYDQEYLFRDKNNEYWKLNILRIEFKKFCISNVENEKYCEKVLNFLSEFDLKTFFSKKISSEQYFNKCELEYLAKYYPDMLELALSCREKVIENNRKKSQEELRLKIKEKEETVEKVNRLFNEAIKGIKEKIYNGESINIVELSFYKDSKYENGITKQNCILYLAKKYEIKIPLATQGFINNRLINYNFKDHTGYFEITNNKRCSKTMRKYLDMIYEKVKEEKEKTYNGNLRILETGFRRNEPIALVEKYISSVNRTEYIVAFDYTIDEKNNNLFWSYGRYYYDRKVVQKAYKKVINGGNLDFSNREER